MINKITSTAIIITTNSGIPILKPLVRSIFDLAVITCVGEVRLIDIVAFISVVVIDRTGVIRSVGIAVVAVLVCPVVQWVSDGL